MRKHDVLDAARRQAGALAGAAHEAERPGARRRLLAGLAALVLVAVVAFGAWRGWFAPAEAPAAAPAAPVPEHQRSGPLANPWGNEAPVTPSRAEEAAAAAAAAAAASAAAAAAAPAPGAAAAAGRAGVPPSREALRQALARLRSGGPVAEFVNAAVKERDAAALVAIWMVERQCRQVAHWRQIIEWRSRAAPNRAATPGPSAASIALCAAMPESGQVDAALAAAGFPTEGDVPAELTRRPIDFALAVSVGDPMLLADVMEASDSERVGQQMRAWGVDGRDLVSPEVQRAAVWLASCTPLDASGRPGGSATLLAACKEHPAVWQACLHQGLCDVRDLRDLLLRSLSATEMGAVERLARTLAPRMGR